MLPSRVRSGPWPLIARALSVALLVHALAGCGGASTRNASSTGPAAEERAHSVRDLPPEELERVLYAVALIDAGHYDDAIAVFDELLERRPYMYAYGYEKGLAMYRKGDLLGTIAILGEWCLSPDATGMCYSLLGNAYDDHSEPDGAEAVYRKGIERFPEEGLLYVNLGIMQLRRNDAVGALESFESGMLNAPLHPSSYYWATQVYAASNTPLWALIYGEIFLNLETPTSKRWTEISQALYQVYVNSVSVETRAGADGAKEQMFTHPLLPDGGQTMEVSAHQKEDGTLEIVYPFGGAYSMVFGVAYSALPAAPGGDVSIAELHALRSGFLDAWSQMAGMTRGLPNAVIAFHERLRERGLFEAYDHWLFSGARASESAAWLDSHAVEYNALKHTLAGDTGLGLSSADKFSRKHYPNP